MGANSDAPEYHMSHIVPPRRGIDTLEKPFRENNCLNLQLDEAEALECVYGRQPDSDFMWLHRPKDTHDGEAT